eukprot:2748003-Karenia_brevis.AAC.1
MHICIGCRTSAVVTPKTSKLQILAAGEWKSPAFLAYLDLHLLDTELVRGGQGCYIHCGTLGCNGVIDGLFAA